MIHTLSYLMHGWRQALAGVPGYAERLAAYEMVIRAHWRAMMKGK